MSSRLLPTVFVLVWTSSLILSLIGSPQVGAQAYFFSLLAPMVAVVGLGAGMRAFFQGFRLLKRKRRIQNTPTSTIRAAALGRAKIRFAFPKKMETLERAATLLQKLRVPAPAALNP